MKLEPLKGKGQYSTYYGNSKYALFKKKDIKSAVEWLKNEIINEPIDNDVDMRAIYCNIIDEAFEDVRK